MTGGERAMTGERPMSGGERSTNDVDPPAAWFDWLTLPLLVAGGLAASAALLARLSPTATTVVLTTALVVVLLALERLRPQRARGPREEPLLAELGHVLLGVQVGSVLGYAGAIALAEALTGGAGPRGWPDGWALAAQVALGLAIVDVVNYGQHRLVHRVGWLWPFHALHHQSRALDLVKTGRFHLVDIATVTFAAHLPLVALGAAPVVVAWVVNVNAIGGLLQHANVRMPTPRWLDGIVCTPAAHWRHHSRAPADDGNFATLLTLFDRAFGTWVPTRGVRPSQLGLVDDPLPRGWLAAIVAPFHRRARPR
jgi:lathosterol oxidase